MPEGPPSYNGAMTENEAGTRPIANAVGKILSEGQKVRERIAELVTSTMKGKDFRVSALAETATNVVTSAYQVVGAQVEHAVPRDQEGVLRDVVYGVGDAFGAAAQGVKQTFDDATTQGKSFASEDVARLGKEMSGMVATFVASVASAGTSAMGHATEFVQAATQHANTAAEEIGPSVESAMSAATSHPIELTSEAAKAGLAAGRQVAGSLFSVLGDIMHQAARSVQPPSPEADDAASKDDKASS